MSTIAITNPPWYYKDENGKLRIGIRAGSRWPFTIEYQKDIGYRPFPFFMAHAMSYLLSKGIAAHFVDSITANHTYTQFFNIINDLDPQIVLIEISTPSAQNDLTIARMLHNKGRKVVLAGTHATVFADELIKLPYVDAVLKGEYEKNLLQYIETRERRIYESISLDLNSLPVPYRDDNLIWNYREKTHGNKERQISLMTSRGCPFKCIFCQWPRVMMNNKVKYLNVENVTAEIDHLVDYYGNDIFLYFDDDTFNFLEDRTLKIGEGIAKHGLEWSAMCRIDTLSKEAWTELYKMGLHYINIGIETANPELLETVGKKLDIVEAEEMIAHLKNIGMYIHGTFTYGIPGETPEDQQRTKEFFQRTHLDSKQESQCMPLPGTIWYNSLSEEEKNMDFDGYRNRGESILENNEKK
jgi:radical SAM superfamily enzyme YgiQ (UPF0313 family)